MNPKQAFWKKLLPYVILFILILIGIHKYNQLINSHLSAKELDRKRYLIAMDSLTKISKGRYVKLANDMHDKSSLLDELELTNQNLYQDIKKSKRKIISLTSTVLHLESKIEDLKLDKPIEFGDTLDFHYPSKDTSFVTHSLIIKDVTTLRSMWSFTPLKLDMVVTEKEPGIYQVDLGTEKFVTISSFELNSLPISPPIKRPIFGWTYGAGVYTSPSGLLGADLYGGLRISNFNLLLRVQPSTTPQFGAVLLYNTN